MAINMDVLCPGMVFFNEGQVIAGVGALLMQMTLVLWPMATKAARAIDERSNIERMLAELSETHRVKHDPYARPMKKFRQVA